MYYIIIIYYLLIFFFRNESNAHVVDIRKSKKSHKNLTAIISHIITSIILQFRSKKKSKRNHNYQVFYHSNFFIIFLFNRFCKSFSNYLKNLIPEIQTSLDHFTQHERLTKRPFENALNEQFINSNFKDKVLYFFLKNNIPFQTLRSKSFKNMIRYCRK